MSFSTLGLTPSLCAPLARMGYTEPTPVQAASIPVVLDGADIACFEPPVVDHGGRAVAADEDPARARGVTFGSG